MDNDPPEITILLLGDSDVGKSTFLARLSCGTKGHNAEIKELPVLRDSDQPFLFEISLFKRPYRFQFYDTSSPDHYSLLRPDFIVLCFDINNRKSLESVQERWSREILANYMYNRELPIMLLGLKRDLRVVDENTIYPQEAHRIAQEMRCDRYAECSAVTGELIFEVFEDIARTAAMTSKKPGGGLSEGPTCTVT
ncbi:P-loop containing nucleoside triphosphate hydrolase protein [Xylona heveae TC161]|uniref:p-loop containing nucleoside triphosphate hydrolase protein n=1 Tax=Xylona heveae (strain CBS 132557 / TC161) TaxID=1328760 RepID=A0A165IRG5_XYLHT|nr:P-loop containing nucleoside triphosphate hydrolase protein [Xylona heveae TC161]KZF25278.1 P-loop containing nucleoside triphosphate hydrolase protein [Xylona heveae TC161]